MGKFRTILGKENNNELQRIQRILLNQMERLDDNDIMAERSKKEIMRSGALSQSAGAFIKSVQTQIKVLDLSDKFNVETKDMNAYLGIEDGQEENN